MPPSINIHAGPLGQVQVGGLFAFAGRAQSNVYPGASGPAGKTFSAAVSDALISISKDTGTWQFYLEGGAYNFYVVGQPPSSTGNIINATFGPWDLVRGNFSNFAKRGSSTFHVGSLRSSLPRMR